MLNIDINKNLNDQQKNIHSVFSDYMKQIGVIDLGNNFELYEYVERNVALKDFLISESKKSTGTADIKTYCCIDGAKSGWLRPRLFYVNSDYIVDVSRNRDVFVYDNNMELIFNYSINFNSFSINRIDFKSSDISFNTISNFFDFEIDKKLIINRSIKNDNIYSLFDKGYKEYKDKKTINNIHFNESNIELLLKNGMYDKLVLDYNFNIMKLVFSDDFSNKLQVKEINNVMNINELFEKLKTNFDIYFLTTDSSFISEELKTVLEDNISKIKKLTTVKTKVFETFNKMEYINDKYINSVDNKYVKNYLFKFCDINVKTTRADLDLNLNSNINKLLNNEKTLKTIEYTQNYYPTMATLKLLKDNNENLIDINLIEEIIKLKNMMADLNKDFKKQSIPLISNSTKIK